MGLVVLDGANTWFGINRRTALTGAEACIYIRNGEPKAKSAMMGQWSMTSRSNCRIGTCIDNNTCVRIHRSSVSYTKYLLLYAAGGSQRFPSVSFNGRSMGCGAHPCVMMLISWSQ